MLRSILTDKWFIGACFVLIVFVPGCMFWSQHELAPYKKAADESAERHRQLEAAQKEADNSKMVESVNDEVVDSNAISENIEGNRSQTADMLNNKDVAVSPFGFGPYPELPEDFPEQELFSTPHGSAKGELLDRVRVKLWKEGKRPDGIGYLQSTGLIYPTVQGTIYVRMVELHGKKYITRLRSHPADHFDISKLDSEDDIPSHLKVLQFSDGIDPYEYLDLPKEVNE